MPRAEWGIYGHDESAWPGMALQRARRHRRAETECRTDPPGGLPKSLVLHRQPPFVLVRRGHRGHTTPHWNIKLAALSPLRFARTTYYG